MLKGPVGQALALIGALCFLSASPMHSAAVSGAVLDAGARPLPDVEAALLPLLTSFEAGRLRLRGQAEPMPIALAHTDASGRFRLAAPAGIFRVVVRSPGHLPMQYAPLALVEDEELPEVALQPAAQTAVRVLDARGQPIAGAWVLATRSAEPRSARGSLAGWREDLRLLLSGDNGEIDLPRAAGEELDLTVFAPGRGENQIASFEGQAISVQQLSGPPRRIRVMGSDRKPLGGILIATGERLWPLGLTGEDGSLDVALPSGPVRLGLLADDGRRQSFELANPPPEGGDILILAEARRVRGRVIREADQRPLGEALVWASHEPARFVHSDAQGNYELVSPAGGFQLQALAAGFLPRRARLEAGRLSGGRFPTLALVRSASLAGRVVDADGSPLESARLFAFAEPQADSPPGNAAVLQRASSDAQGWFRLRSLRQGLPYRVVAARAGFFSSSMRSIASAPGSEGAALRLVLTRSRAGQGWVEDEDGVVVPGAEVEVAPASRELASALRALMPGSKAITTDAKGQFWIAGLPAAQLDLTVRKPGFAPAYRRGISVAGEQGPANLGTVVLSPGSRIAGQIVDMKGRPIAGATVYRLKELRPGAALEPALRQRVADAVSRADGQFELRDLEQGTPVQIAAEAEGFMPAAVRGVRPPAERVSLRLEAGTDLRGRLVDAAGEPVPGGLVELSSALQVAHAQAEGTRSVGPLTVRAATSDRQGRFELHNVPARNAKLAVTASGFEPVEELPVELPQPAGEPELVVVLKPGATIEGTVRRASGEPVSGARVRASGVGAATDDDGAYALAGLAPGPTVVEVVHPHFPRTRKQILVDSPLTRLDFELADGISVSGRVVDTRGERIAGALVQLAARSNGNQLDYRALSQSDGLFQFSQVAPASYRLRAQDSAHAPVETEAAVEVAGEPIAGLEVVMLDEAVIRGHVLGLDASELAEVTVQALSNGGVAAPARLDSGGQYEIRALPGGDWRVRATLRSDERQVEAFVSLAPGQQVERDLEFGGRSALRGVVIFDGEPLAEATVSLRAHLHALARSMTTDWQGGFRFEELEADTYWLGVDHVVLQLVHNETVEVTGDREIVVTLSAASITGSVADGISGQPVGGAVLELRPVPGSAAEFLMTGASRADGTFRLSRVPAGSYRLLFRAAGYSSSTLDLSINSQEERTGLDVELEPATGLRLVVHLADGRDPPTIHLAALAADGHPGLAETRTREPDGSFLLSSLAAGSWTLLVGADGGALSVINVSVPGEAVAVTLPPAGKLSVSVLGLAATNLLATMRLFDMQGQLLRTLGMGGQVEESWALIGGRGVIANVPAGTWHLLVEAPDGRTWEVAVTHPGIGDLAVVVE